MLLVYHNTLCITKLIFTTLNNGWSILVKFYTAASRSRDGLDRQKMAYCYHHMTLCAFQAKNAPKPAYDVPSNPTIELKEWEG